MSAAALLSVAYYLPQQTCSTSELAAEFPEWGVEKIDAKTGIGIRHIAAHDETSADMAFQAAQRLFESGAITPQDVDFVVLCTQSPDHFLPTSACILQERLGVSMRAGAFDYNLGCSGFVYGLGIAKGLVETGQARNILLLTAESYSKFMHSRDKTARTIFGDGAAAAWIGAVVPPSEGAPYIARPLYGTDGRGAKNLIVRRGALRVPGRGDDPDSFLYMNGPEIFHFTLDAVSKDIKRYIEEAELQVGEIDLFIPHQANQFMLESIRVKLGIPRERFSIRLREFGNTVSSTIPIAIVEEAKAGRLKPDARVLLSGFGVGYSWASVLMRWHPKFQI